MNKCRFNILLNDYLDGALSEDKKSQLLSHIEQCSSCAQELSELKKLASALKEWQVPGLTEGFEARVKDEIVRQELKKSEAKMETKTIWRLVPVGALATVIVAFVVVGNLMTANFRSFKGQHRVLTRTDGGEFGRGSGEYEPYYASDNKYLNDKPAVYAAKEKAMRQAVESQRANTLSATRVLKNDGNTAQFSYDVRSGNEYMASGLTLPTEIPASQALEGSVIVIQPSLPATGEGDKIIRTGLVQLEVENGKDTYKQVAVLCQELGGYLASSNFYKDGEGRESGTITMRIPKAKFDTALEKLSSLGKVENINSDSQDVSQQYANLKSQLDAAMVVYNKMLEALQKKQVSITEAARLESELTPVLQRVQALKNQIEALNNAVSFTTVTVNFHEATVTVKALKESRGLFAKSMLAFGINANRFVAGALPNIIVLAVIAVVMIMLALVLKTLIQKILKK